jgi:membrane-bound metal-dependent hydrolase YbcI (DUF457 family)
MMGPAHSLSGAAIWLGGTATYSYITQTPIDPVVLVMGTAVLAGAALGPDLDSYTSTVTRSFGIFGRILYYLTNGLSLVVHAATRTHKDQPVENGHRTLMHTLVAAIGVGLLTLALTSLPGTVTIFDKEYATGQLFALGIMAFFLHLGMAGLLSKQIKKAKKSFGPYLLMLVSLTLTVITAFFLPTYDTGYQWLAFVVGGGWAVHIAGDSITKMGTPFLWPIKLRGKRWYDIALPGPLRITAGGAFEMKILTPVFLLVIAAGLVINILLALNIL